MSVHSVRYEPQPEPSLEGLHTLSAYLFKLGYVFEFNSRNVLALDVSSKEYSVRDVYLAVGHSWV